MDSPVPAITEALHAALDEAQKLVEAGWANEDHTPIIFRHGEDGSSRGIDPVVWVMMKAISTGIGMKSQMDREEKS